MSSRRAETLQLEGQARKRAQTLIPSQPEQQKWTARQRTMRNCTRPWIVRFAQAQPRPSPNAKGTSQANGNEPSRRTLHTLVNQETTDDE
jgi:hypothetical protein